MVNSLVIRHPQGVVVSENCINQLLQYCEKYGYQVKATQIKLVPQAETIQESYCTRLQQATKAFQYICEAYIHGEQAKQIIDEKKIANLKVALSFVVKEERKFILKLEQQTNESFLHQDFVTYLQQLTALLVKLLKVKWGRAKKILEKGDEYRLLVQPRPAQASLLMIPADVTSHYNRKHQAHFKLSAHFAVMLDIPQPPFSDEMAASYISAWQEGTPDWFDLMPEHERILFRYALRDVYTKDDLNERICSIPSRLRTIPGVANHLLSFVMVMDNAGNVYANWTPTARSSMPASRDLPFTERELRLKFTEDNIKHLYGNWISVVYGNNLSKDKLLEITNKPFVWQTLISPSYFLSLLFPDEKLHRDKVSTAEKIANSGIQLQGQQVNPKIYTTNHPLNYLSWFAKTNSYFQTSNTAEQINLLIQCSRELIKAENLQDGLLIEAVNDLEKALSMNSMPANADPNHRELWLAALQKIIVIQSGGCIPSSCVSGKDREAAVNVMVGALLITYFYEGRLPKYWDNLDESQAEFFVETSARIFLSNHHQQLAACNGVGAVGMKTPRLYLPTAVCNAIEAIEPGCLSRNDRLASNIDLSHVIKNNVLPQAEIDLVIESYKKTRQEYSFFSGLQKHDDLHEVRQEIVNLLISAIQKCPPGFKFNIRQFQFEMPAGIKRMQDAIIAMQLDKGVNDAQHAKTLMMQLAQICEDCGASFTRSKNTSKLYQYILTVNEHWHSDWLYYMKEKIKNFCQEKYQVASLAADDFSPIEKVQSTFQHH